MNNAALYNELKELKRCDSGNICNGEVEAMKDIFLAFEFVIFN